MPNHGLGRGGLAGTTFGIFWVQNFHCSMNEKESWDGFQRIQTLTPVNHCKQVYCTAPNRSLNRKMVAMSVLLFEWDTLIFSWGELAHGS
jgi:hypothetical protein